MTMPRAFLIVIISMLLAARGFGFSAAAGNKGLAEVKGMKGVKVAISNKRIQSFGPDSNEMPLVEVYFAFTPENDLLGKGHFTGIQNVRLIGVELHSRDQTGDTLSVAPLQSFEHTSLEDFLALSDSGLKRGTLICFSIDKRLIKYSFLRFIEQAPHGTQWTDVYFGGEPEPPKYPPLPKQNPNAPQGPIQLIPGLEPPSGTGKQ